MLICLDCGAIFEQARIVFERHGLDTPPYEELLVCPRCESTEIHPAHRCDVCGEWITDSYIKTADGERICGDCYSRCEVEDD